MKIPTEADRRAKNASKKTGGPGRYCGWHKVGKPVWAPSRFFQEGCPKCEDKLAAGQVSRDDPRPAEYRGIAGWQKGHARG